MMFLTPYTRRCAQLMFLVGVTLNLSLAITGCESNPAPTPTTPPVTPINNASSPVNQTKVQVVEQATNGPDQPMSAAIIAGLSVEKLTGPIQLTSARNEWVTALLVIHPTNGPAAIELPILQSNGQQIDVKNFRAYQVLPVPVDVNRAGFVRHTGLPAAVESLPRALLPMPIENGRVDLSRCRNPIKPADAAARALGSGQPIVLWIDMRIPTDAPAGQYAGAAILLDPTAAVRVPLASVGFNVSVMDFVLPDDRHLVMVGELPWETLKRHWSSQFEVIEPHLLSRTDKNHQQAIATIDQMQTLAQAHRAQIYLPRLQPTVKWPALQPPQIDWSDFDGLLTPWMNGSAFPDRVPLGYWPLPKTDYLDNFAIQPRLEYYGSAASHFDQLDWLRGAPITIGQDMPGRANMDQRLTLSAEAQRILGSHPRVRVQLPLELDEVQIADERNPNLVDSRLTSRLNCVAPGLISSSPLRKWPDNLERPETWLRTDLRGLMPYAGGGEQSDVRVWAWMASLRGARVIEWGNCLPTTSALNEASDPSEIIWFYPGEWFGVDEVVPTVQLKWMRRAQQDFEYLFLARERKSVLNVLPMARVLTKPVEIQAGQAPDPTYSLLVGTADALAWREASALLGRVVMIRGPGIQTDENQLANLNLDTLKWIEPLEKPVILPRSTIWTVGTPDPGSVGPWVNLKLGLDIYNASDTNLDQNELRFSKGVPGWIYLPPPVTIPKLTVYEVSRHYLNARVDPLRARLAEHAPVQVEFRSGFSGRTTPVDFVAPVSQSMRRTANLTINGSLDDWLPDDLIQNAPLVKMFSRPAVQQHELEISSTPTQIFSGWSGTDLYLAFRVGGLSGRRNVLAARNFVSYQYGRAWDEDLCQVVVQAMYEDGTTGPLIHIALKPGGNVWVEQKLDPRFNVNPWQNFNPNVRYASTLDQAQALWRGELAIPWTSLIAPEKTSEFAKLGKPNLPVMLKLNFIQHKRDTGESASWAGPLDVGRDDAFTGVIVLKEVEKSDTPDNPK